MYLLELGLESQEILNAKVAKDSQRTLRNHDYYR